MDYVRVDSGMTLRIFVLEEQVVGKLILVVLLPVTLVELHENLNKV